MDFYSQFQMRYANIGTTGTRLRGNLINGQQSINTGELEAGNYILKMQGSDGTYGVKMFVKE